MNVLYALVTLLPLWFFACYLRAKQTGDADLGKRGVITASGHAARVFWSNAAFLVPLAVVVGGLGQVVSLQASELARDWAAQGTGSGPGRQQALLVASELTWQLVWCAWNCVFGAFSAAATLYFWQCEERKQPADAYAAINFALNRFSRVLPAHAKAFLFITLGNFIIVPGIWFGLQYAFVDAIATFDYEEKAPLSRSQRLVQPRLRTIGTVFLPIFFFWWFPGQFLHFELQGRGVEWIAAAGAIEVMVYQLIDLTMVQLYLDRFRKPSTTPVAAPVAS